MALGGLVGPPAAVRGTLDLADRTEVRRRDAGLSTDPSLDVMTRPGLQLALATPRSRWEFGYFAKYTLINLQIEVKPTLLNEAYVSAQWFASRRTRLTLTQDGSWGRQSFIGMAVVQAPASAGAQPASVPATGAAPAPQIQSVPSVDSFSYVSWTPSLKATSTLSHRWTLDTTALYQVDGGFDEAAKRILPLKWGPGLAMRAEYALSRRDKLFSAVTANRTAFSSGPRTILVGGSQGIRRRLTRRTDAELEVGAAVAQFAPSADAPTALTPFPTATALLSHQYVLERGADVRFDVSGHLGPTIHRLLGFVTQTLQATANVTLTAQRLVWQVGAGASETLPRDDPRAFRIVYGQANVAYTFSKVVVVDTGVRYVRQDQFGSGAPTPQKVVYVGVTVREPTLRF
jgi:hypothetical protein